MTKATTKATANDLTPTERASRTVFEMENMLIDARCAATALSLIGETMSETEGMVTCFLARHAIHNIDKLEELRISLFEFLHRSREEFEQREVAA